MDADVVVPWKSGCPHREAAWAWVRPQYKAAGLNVIEGSCPPGPWVKALALQDAIDRSTAETLVLADADVWCHGLPEVLERLDDKPAVIPHGKVLRLTQVGTRQFIDGQRFPMVEQEHRGMPGGGLLIVTRELWERCPMDPRFVGWGQEDFSLATAITTLTGKIRRFSHPLIHLWHPPQPRLDRATGSAENRALEARYLEASGDPVRMTALLTEAREALRRPAWHSSTPPTSRTA